MSGVNYHKIFTWAEGLQAGDRQVSPMPEGFGPITMSGVLIPRIVDELWCERPSRSATNLVQQYVSRVRYLRRCANGQAGDDVRTHSPGYVLEWDDDDVDAAVFESGVDAAREA